MSLVDVVRTEVRRALSRFELLSEIVTSVVVDGNGRASGKGAGDQDVDADVGGMFGFYGYAPDGSTGISIKLGGKRASAILTVLRHTKYEPSLNKGECAMQNAFGAEVLLDKNGAVVATPAAGQTVQLGGNTYSLPKWDDFLTALNAWVTAVNAVLASNCVNGSPLSAQAAQLAAETLFATKTSGSLFKSTVATNG